MALYTDRVDLSKFKEEKKKRQKRDTGLPLKTTTNKNTGNHFHSAMTRAES